MAFARWDRELAWAVGLLLLACNGDGTSPPGPPTDLAKSGGDGQSWYFNNPLPVSLSVRSEEHTSELQSRLHLVCRLLLEKKKEIIRATSPAIALMIVQEPAHT